MPEEKKASRYNFLKLEFIFTNEPYWFRCVVILAGLAGHITVIWVLQKWAAHAGLMLKNYQEL
ncbi:MAG TPA: hypothetical protein VHD83_25855 [Puia sp.]|nr:hypothetical protein [Puia sp.]